MSSNLDRLQRALSAWHDTKGAERQLFEEMMADPFELRHVDNSNPGIGFATNTTSRETALNYLVAIFDGEERSA